MLGDAHRQAAMDIEQTIALLGDPAANPYIGRGLIELYWARRSIVSPMAVSGNMPSTKRIIRSWDASCVTSVEWSWLIYGIHWMNCVVVGGMTITICPTTLPRRGVCGRRYEHGHRAEPV